MSIVGHTDPLWEPTPEQANGTNLASFQRWLARERSLTLATYDELWTWSVTDLDGFWSAIWQFHGMDAVSDYDCVLRDHTMPGAQWFPGARLNFAEQLLAAGDAADIALVTVGEDGQSTSVNRAELRRQVASLATTLQNLGVGQGDRVVGYLPNIAEAVVAFLATASVGAIWSSVGQDYAAGAVINRFAQLESTVLVTADGYRFAGRDHDRREAIDHIRVGLPTLAHTIVIPRLGLTPALRNTVSWYDATAAVADYNPVRVSFDHPLWVLFSSGTTGLPKGLVHSHGGILLEQLKNLGLHWDLKPHDRLFWFTSPSWVVWNLFVSSLLLGSSIVCYDGSPTYPDPSTLWRLVDRHEATIFGTSPGYLQATEDAGLDPVKNFDLRHLRILMTSGAPLPPAIHRWAKDHVGNIPLFSISGGTDVASAFAGGSPTVPVWPGELSVRCLGVALEAWDDQGQPVTDHVGELVVTAPMPSMPVHFWNDPDGSRYREAYFSTFPGAWRHGDWVTVTNRGSVVIHGRSDSTINRNGVRMGSADIYNAVETIPEVAEALVVGAEQADGDYWMPLFVVLRDGVNLDDELTTLINITIRDNVSPQHVPDEIIAVPGFPHTRTGKKLEVPIKRLMQGASLATVVNPDAIDDPSLLETFVAIALTHASDRSG